MIEEMRKFDEANYYDVEDIAGALLKLSEIDIEENPEISIDLLKALYWLESAAKNEYNPDYWRTLYNVLLRIV